MLIKLFWIARVFGYVASLAGVFLYLAHGADASPDLKNLGLGIVGAGFIGFFISYAIRAWLRFGARPKTIDRRQP